MAHHDEVFDAEPATELSEGEPRTPMWMPALGLALFILFGLWWSVGGEDESAPEGAAPVVKAQVLATANPSARAPRQLQVPTQRGARTAIPQQPRRPLRALRDGAAARPPKGAAGRPPARKPPGARKPPARKPPTAAKPPAAGGQK